jgi:hypothetical protein
VASYRSIGRLGEEVWRLLSEELAEIDGLAMEVLGME